jgi:homoserine kinase
VVRGANAQRFDVSSRLYFVLLIPALEVKTSLARRILPGRVSRLEAIETCANACSITAAFASHNYHSLRESFGDHLHQPFRKKLIPFLSRVIATAEDAGALGAFLSGSGSTIAAVTLKDPQKVAEAMRREIDNCDPRVLITRADNTGARFLKSPITSH